ncbi:MAG: endonuclease V [Candidatus Nezhaarchaeota archaeon]|nr:endonuclease V [Candidatus Nezhaarchaeota archaeon]
MHVRAARLPHSFDVEKARRAQRLIASMAKEEEVGEVKVVAGADVASRRGLGRIVSAVVLLEWGTWRRIEEVVVELPELFPYIPTLLSFREAPSIMAGLRKVKVRPDVVFIDGQGKAHPQRCGLATHVGVVLNIPTVGVAKKKLFGVEEPFSRGVALLRDPELGEVVGAAVTTKEGSKPIYVSVGHRVTLSQAIELVLKSTLKDKRLPEPILAAHSLATRAVREGLEGRP